MKSHRHLAQLIFIIFQAILQCRTMEVTALDANADREALVSFKYTIFDPKYALSGWNHSSSHCTWPGVSCTSTGNRVQSLRLTGLGLSGPLSPHLANLTFLQVLNLTNNSLYGPIPSRLSRLSLLKYFSLSGNRINGTIPASLSRCHRLKHLSLDFNELSGSLPPELGSLSRLRLLNVALNNLVGIVPATLGNLSSLSLLNLGRNQLSGEIPTQLGRLSMLHTLYLCENFLTGEIPHSIYNLSSLAVLSLVKNNLAGELPPNMGIKLLNLKELYLGANRLGGFIPPSLSNATQLEVLDLTTNGFGGSIPPLGSLNRLTTLKLGMNNLSSNTELNHHLFASLANCTQLEVMVLNSNHLAGELPSSFANLSAHLQHFCFDDNFLSGHFPRGLEKFQNLSVISLANNIGFTGEIPNSISVLNKLARIEIQDNMFSGQIPDVFRNLTQLFLLKMTNNHFSGQIPQSIGLCGQLQVLSLSRNKLKGSIPKQIFGLRSLISLNLAQNSLLGSLPDEIGGMVQLEVMDVSDNQLSGHLPETIGGCSSLRYLILARNKFTGLIPNTIEHLAGIERLDLSSNNLSGSIPEELGKFWSLQSLNLSFNDLEGQVPSQGVFLNLSWDSLQGNLKLCAHNQTLSRRWRVPLCEEKKGSTHLLLKLIIVTVSSMVLVFALLCLIWRLIVRKKKKDKEVATSLLPLGRLLAKISYNEIQLATNGFAAENLIGEGSFGSVYRGTFSANDNNVRTTFAVKVLDLHQTKAVKSFHAECEALRNVRHRNLVKVITSCSSIDHNGNEFKALVMEFLPNGSLDKWLHPNDTDPAAYLTLSQRVDVAIDVASAMDYLHHDCEQPIVHCDLKPANVLLDDEMGAHVGDFGLARFLSPTSSQKESSTIGLKGSIGYIPPEYGVGSRAWPSGDVYSFGILLLEMFTAKKPTDEMFKEGLDLKTFASAVEQNRVLGIADPRLFEMSSEPSEDGSYSGSRGSNNCNSSWQSRSEECIADVIGVGMSCAHDSACNRLTMRETLAKLKEIKEHLLGQ